MFKRLGGKTAVKRAATSTSEDLDSSDEGEDALEYAGVLKHAGSPQKKVKLTKTVPSATAAKKKQGWHLNINVPLIFSFKKFFLV